MEYKDNILGQNLLEQLQQVLDNEGIPWYYSGNTAFLEEDERHIFDGSFSHLVSYDGNTLSNMAPFLEGVCYTAFDNANIKVDKLIRIRLGLITPTEREVIHKPHVDLEYPHKSALLYINDSDGDTIFYNEMYKDTITEYTEWKRVSPKANRFVWFDGHRYHSSSTPREHSKRLVMNINYV